MCVEEEERVDLATGQVSKETRETEARWERYEMISEEEASINDLG